MGFLKRRLGKCFDEFLYMLWLHFLHKTSWTKQRYCITLIQKTSTLMIGAEQHLLIQKISKKESRNAKVEAVLRLRSPVIVFLLHNLSSVFNNRAKGLSGHHFLGRQQLHSSYCIHCFPRLIPLKVSIL